MRLALYVDKLLAFANTLPRVATFSGLPAPTPTQQHSRSIGGALDVVSKLVPAWWNVLFSVMEIAHTAMGMLDGIEDHALHFSVTQLFSDQLDQLKHANIGQWPPELEIEWCNAKLYLLALTFTKPATTDPMQNMQIRIYHQSVLQRCFEAATSIISQFVKLGQLNVSELYPDGLLRFVPGLYFTSLFNATAFLFRIMATHMTPTPALRSRAMGSIIEAHKIFQSYPERRELTRAAIHIEALIDTIKQGAPVGMSELAVKNKLGASVMFDAVFHACRQRNLDPRTGRPLLLRDWRTVTETFPQRLPEAPAEKTTNDDPQSGPGNDNVVLDEQFLVPTDANMPWWDEWDQYIDLFQVGGEQLDMELEQPLDGR